MVGTSSHAHHVALRGSLHEIALTAANMAALLLGLLLVLAGGTTWCSPPVQACKHHRITKGHDVNSVWRGLHPQFLPNVTHPSAPFHSVVYHPVDASMDIIAALLVVGYCVRA